MTLNILKSEDIIFKTKSGEKVVDLKHINLDMFESIEGLSEHSVLQLEYNGKTYLLTEEFSVEALLDVLDEFIEEYDEEDSDTFEFDEDEDIFTVDEDEYKIVNEFEEELQKEKEQEKEQEKSLEKEESVHTQIEQQQEEEHKKDLESSPFLWKKTVEIANSSDIVESVVESSSEEQEIVQIESERIIMVDDSSLVQEKSSEEIANEKILEEHSTLSTPPISMIQIQAEIETRVITKALVRLEDEALVRGDLNTLEIDGFTDTEDNINQLNDVLVNINQSIDVNLLQNIANTLLKLSLSRNLSVVDFRLLGLKNLSEEDVNDLNIALKNPNSLALGDSPSSNLQIILDSLNAIDSLNSGVTTSIRLNDLSNIGVVGVEGMGSISKIGTNLNPTLEDVTEALKNSMADDTNTIQAVVNDLQLKVDVFIRLEQGVLIVGDLTLLGIGGLSDNSGNIARVNSTLLDSDVSKES
jgi:hypothetical protein